MKLALICLLALGVPLVGYSSDDPGSEAFFESRIRPALVKHCYECHSEESGKSKGGLRLDTRESTRLGGDTGAAVTPKNGDESLLLLAIQHLDVDLEMPPKQPKLPDQVIHDFEAWIQAGAFDPRESATTSAELDQEARQSRLDFWSYQKPRQPELPKTTSDWPLSPIDHFILAKLDEKGLSPSADADQRTFVRRLYFDLIGLPPSPQQVADFSYQELDKIVDNLLASNGFGVRWGRHWLDVVRYAESNGGDANIVYPHAWRYRDYVIDAVNADVPYDRFLIEQVAGDLLDYDSEAERARLQIATGFLAIGSKGLAGQDKPQFAADLVDEQLDVTGRAILASSIACARCHDHKADPISMQDYYSLVGIFRSTKTYFGTWIDSENNTGGELIELPDLPGQLKPGQVISKDKVEQMKAQVAKLNEQERKGKEMASTMQPAKKLKREDFNAAVREALRIYWSRGGLVGKLATVDDDGQPLPLCMGVLEAAEMGDSRLYYRGDLKTPGEEVARGVPALFGMPAAPPADKSKSGRLALAHWLASADNPLTARVMANRVWGHLIGTGLVRTADSFGHGGEAPSHPELLDHLAIQLRQNDWSLKALVKQIVVSRAYRQRSEYRQDSFLKDPDNRLVWRANKRRLDAEIIRDSMLAVSGKLDLSPRPGSLAAEVSSHSVPVIAFDKSIPSDLDDSNYRSVYLPVFRENLPDVLHLFDFAEPSFVVGDRDETNVPPQALYLMNSEFVMDQSAAFAKRLMQSEKSRGERIRRAFQICFNRDPDAGEIALVSEYFANSGEVDETTLTARFCQALLGSAEFRIAD